MRSYKNIFLMLLTACLAAASLSSCKPSNNPVTGESANQIKERIFTPVSKDELDFLVQVSTPQAILQNGRLYSRFTDTNSSLVYRFKGTVGQKAAVLLEVGSEYKISVSFDNKNWVDIMDNYAAGRWSDRRPIDLTAYFKNSDTVYLRMTDSVPTDGYGGVLSYVKYLYYQGNEAKDDENMVMDISTDWHSSIGGDYTAGASISAEPGTEVTFTREFTIPKWWRGQSVSFSFPWIETKNNAVICVNGKQISSSTHYGQNYTITLPKEMSEGKVLVEVKTKTKENGKTGLWGPIRAGLTELVTLPPLTWTLDSETRKLSRNYDHNDLISLNSLAGNYIAAMINPELNMIPFSAPNSTRSNIATYYPHDNSRSLLALADEEAYSPVVRLDAMRKLYQGIKKSMVPGSDYEIFLKYDTRSKMVGISGADSRKLQWYNQNDTIEPFASVYVTGLDAKGKKFTLDNLTYTNDKVDENSLKRDYKLGSGMIAVDAKISSGTSDIPLTASFTPKGMDQYSIVIDDFDKAFYNYSYTSYVTADKKRTNFNGKTLEITPPDENFLLLATPDEYSDNAAILITWNEAPSKILVNCVGRQRAQSVELIYTDGSVSPTITITNFWYYDHSVSWPLRVGENIVKTGKFGAGGYDPTYTCGAEGLGTAALAASAYIFSKYGDPLAEEAKNLAIKAMEAAYRAAISDGYIPGVLYDRVAACHYLVKMGSVKYKSYAEYWADRVLNGQKADGSWEWNDPRFVMTLQRAYEVTGLKKYLNGVNKYRQFVRYTPLAIYYGSNAVTPHWIYFAGAGELGYLGHMGDAEAVKAVIAFSDTNYDDSGVFACSDLNPYMLGWSLKGMMKVNYKDSDKKQIVREGEYVIYKEDGKCTILNYPTVYINQWAP